MSVLQRTGLKAKQLYQPKEAKLILLETSATHQISGRMLYAKHFPWGVTVPHVWTHLDCVTGEWLWLLAFGSHQGCWGHSMGHRMPPTPMEWSGSVSAVLRKSNPTFNYISDVVSGAGRSHTAHLDHSGVDRWHVSRGISQTSFGLQS